MTDDGPIPLDAFRRILRETPEESLTREWERAMEGADPPTAAEQFQAFDEKMAEAVEITPAVERLIRRIVRDELRRMRRRW